MDPMQVLVPVSGEPVDDETVALACDLAKPTKGLVRVLYVIQMPWSLPLDAEVPEDTAKGEQVLQHMERIGKSHKCKVEGEILQARDVGSTVVQEAVDRKAELIVVGLPSRREYGMPSLGDTVPYILKHAPCRVVVTREQLNGWSGSNRRS